VTVVIVWATLTLICLAGWAAVITAVVSALR
jgi:hypothetical protein